MSGSCVQVERLIPCQPSAYQKALFALIETELRAADGNPSFFANRHAV